MADDLASFFKTKKSKKGQKAHGVVVQTADDLAKRLERSVQQQQALDRENGLQPAAEEDEFAVQRPAYSPQISSGGVAAAPVGTEQNIEDSEWLDVQEQQEIDLAQIGIKEMELLDEEEEDSNDGEEPLGPKKTWNIPGQPQGAKQLKKDQKLACAPGMELDDGEGSGSDTRAESTAKEDESIKQAEGDSTKADSEAVSEAEKKPGKYITPAMRQKQVTGAARPGGGKKPNLEDSVEFPSLAAAVQLEEELEKTKKKKQAWKKLPIVPSPAPPPVAPPVANVQRAWTPEVPPAPTVATPVKPTAAVPASTPEPVQEAKAAQQEEPPKSGGPSRYVPPHLRKRGGMS